MRAMQRGKGLVDNVERGGHGAGNVLHSRCGVGNGVDRGRVGIVDDDRGLFPSLSRYP